MLEVNSKVSSHGGLTFFMCQSRLVLPFMSQKPLTQRLTNQSLNYKTASVLKILLTRSLKKSANKGAYVKFPKVDTTPHTNNGCKSLIEDYEIWTRSEQTVHQTVTVNNNS